MQRIARSLALAAGGAAVALVMASGSSAVPLVRDFATATSIGVAKSIAIPVPARAVPGDVLIGVLDVRLSGWGRTLAPHGWSLVRSDTTDAGNRLSQAIYVHVVTEGEPASYAWRFTRGGAATGAIMAVSRADPVHPVEAASGQAASDVRRLGPGALEVLAADSLVLGLYGAAGTSRFDPPSGLSPSYRARERSTGITALAVETVGVAVGEASVRRGRATAAVAQTLAIRAGPLVAGFETGDLSQFDAVTAAPLRGPDASSLVPVSDRVYAGRLAARARVVPGPGDANRFARGTFHVRLEAGSEVWYGGAVYLPGGFYAAQWSQVDILRWDNWTVDQDHTDRGGIVIYGSDHQARLVRGQLGLEQVVLVGPFTISEGSWHWLEVHQRLGDSDGDALSEVFLDGRLVGVSSGANVYGRPVTRFRFGIVACGDCVRTQPLELWLDSATVSNAPIGPVPPEPPAQ